MVGLATVFGAGGGTSSYAEIEDTDVIVMWGSNARDAHPIFFHHVLAGVRNGAQLYVVDPRRSSTAQFADLWLGLHVGTDIALSNTDRPGDHPRRAGQHDVHRAGDDRLRRVRRVGRGVDARAWRRGHRRPGRGHPRAGPRLRPRRPGPDVLDARHHRAPQRRRQRAGARSTSPCCAGTSGRSRRRAQPAARPEQRAGRRRHGRAAQQAARVPGRRGRRGPAQVRVGVGRRRSLPATAGTSPRCSPRWSAATCGRCT